MFEVVVVVQPQENVTLSLETVASALKLPQNCYLLNIDFDFPTRHILC